MGKLIIVSVLTALIMIAFGAFWMFMWLMGTNGYSEAKGGTILAANLVMVILSIVISSAASAFLTRFLQTKTGWSFFAAAPLSIVAVVAAAFAVLFVGSVIVVGVVGNTR